MSASSVPMDVVRQATSRCPPATHILAELPYLPSAVPQARRVLREGMRMAELPEDVRSTAELLVSELVTNAVKYGQPPLWLLIEMRPGLIHASVSDTSTVLPQRRTAAPDAEGGRGLLVLDALAGSWGTIIAESGKYLWFDLPVPPTPASAAEGDGDGDGVHAAAGRPGTDLGPAPTGTPGPAGSPLAAADDATTDGRPARAPAPDPAAPAGPPRAALLAPFSRDDSPATTFPTASTVSPLGSRPNAGRARPGILHPNDRRPGAAIISRPF
ncbi:ATP-binding protein [Frankia sp. AiPs1]|uniref:ATP-binding protein n=1 Tax=Frankia sp. AiPs1 TaxID=573493 RepID=UPI002042F1A3|nr:ATP-binding protein [Frankia sp. AiPs1]MCM3922480.1 ATP-binding protein [Frankia sp. AiPs1]